MRLPLTIVILLCVKCELNGAPVKTIPQSFSPDADDSTIVGTLLKIVKDIPLLKDALEKSGLTLQEIDFLFGERNVFGHFVQDVIKLSPLAGRIMDKAAKSNVLLRVVLDISKGKTPSIFDLFQLTSVTSQNMFNAVDNAAQKDPLIQKLRAQMNVTNPNIPHIFSQITGRTYSDVDVLDNGKYSVGSTANRKNRHLVELFRFGRLNWRNLERLGRTLANLPPNYKKMLHTFCSLDFSPLRFAMDTAPEVNGKKYEVTNNKNKNKYSLSASPENKNMDREADADIINFLHELRVVYPKMLDMIDGPGGMDEARAAIFHLIEAMEEIMNRLLDDSDVSQKHKPKYGITNN